MEGLDGSERGRFWHQYRLPIGNDGVYQRSYGQMRPPPLPVRCTTCEEVNGNLPQCTQSVIYRLRSRRPFDAVENV